MAGPWPPGSRSPTGGLTCAQPYEPGQFFKRELPHLLVLMDRFREPPATIVIDGYVTLGADQRDGLGARLFSALHGQVPVIGVAKSRFAGTPAETEVLRRKSKRPLYVTSRGITLETAKGLIRNMRPFANAPDSSRSRVPRARSCVQSEMRSSVGSSRSINCSRSSAASTAETPTGGTPSARSFRRRSLSI